MDRRNRPQRSRVIPTLGEALLLALALGPTLVVGGAHRPVQLIAALLSVLSLVVVWLHRRPQGRGMSLPWFGVALLTLCVATLLQLVPLPLGLLRALAPATVEVLETSLAKAGGVPGSHPISLDPGATLWQALKLACYSLAFIAAHNLYGCGMRRRRLTIGIMLLGIFLVFLGLTGAIVAPGKPLMLFTPEAGRAAGMITTSFINPNHSAGFLIICALLAMGLAADTRDLQQKVMLGLAMVMLSAGVALSLSRGGILALALGMGLLSLLMYRARIWTRPSQLSVILPGALVLIILVSSWLAYDQLVQELATIAPTQDNGLGKISLWPSGLALIRANPWVGVGHGAFMTAFPRYLQGEISPSTIEFMENQYLQLVAEVGLIAGGAFILAAMLAWVTWTQKRLDKGTELAAAAALFTLGVHNLVDFSFEVIGVGLPLCLLAGALSAACHQRSHRSRSRDRSREALVRRAETAVVLAAAGAATALLLYTAVTRPTHALEDDRTLAALARQKVPLKQYLEAAVQVIRRHPGDYMPHLSAAHQATLAGDPAAIGMLNRALFLFPRSPKIHLLVARTLQSFGAGRTQVLMEFRTAMDNGALYRLVLREAIPLCRSEEDLQALLSDRAQVHTEAVSRLRQERRLELARAVADRGIKRWPGDADLCRQRVEVMLGQADRKSVSTALHCRDLDPSMFSYRVLAKAHRTLGEGNDEVRVLLEAQGLFPESVILAEDMALARLSRQEYEHAVEAAEQLLRLADRTEYLIRAHQVLARIYKEQGREHSARYHLDKAAELQAGY